MSYAGMNIEYGMRASSLLTLKSQFVIECILSHYIHKVDVFYWNFMWQIKKKVELYCEMEGKLCFFKAGSRKKAIVARNPYEVLSLKSIWTKLIWAKTEPFLFSKEYSNLRVTHQNATASAGTRKLVRVEKRTDGTKSSQSQTKLLVSLSLKVDF